MGSDEEIGKRRGLGAAALAVDFEGLGSEEESVLSRRLRPSLVTRIPTTEVSGTPPTAKLSPDGCT